MSITFDLSKITISTNSTSEAMEQDKTYEMLANAHELKKLEIASPAKEVAGRSIGKNGLGYITAIILIGVSASIVLESDKIAAVMGLLSAALMAVIQMVNGVAGTAVKQERPEFAVIQSLIERLDKLDRKEPPMKVTVEGSKVTVSKGDDVVTTAA
jgi:hypothetical protein